MHLLQSLHMFMKYQKPKSSQFTCPSLYQLKKMHLYHVHPGHSFGPVDKKTKSKNRLVEQNDNTELIMGASEVDYSHIMMCRYVSYLSGLSLDASKYYFYSFHNQRQALDYNCCFQTWYRDTLKSSPNLQIYTYPAVAHIGYLPSLTMVSSDGSRRMYEQMGHITAIKFVDNKVAQLSDNYRPYACLAFYGFVGNQLHCLFAYAIVELDQLFDVEQGIQNEEGNCKDKPDGNDEQKRVWVKVYANLVKILSVFVETMGRTVQTFIVQQKQIIILAVRNFVQNENKTGRNKNFRMLIDPMYTITKLVASKPLQSLLLSTLSSTSSTQKYMQIYQKTVLSNRSLSSSEHQLCKKLYPYLERNLLLTPESPKFVGRWFDQLHELTLECIHSKTPSAKPNPFLYQLILANRSFSFFTKMYERKLVGFVEHVGGIEGLMGFHGVAELKDTMYRDGFRLFCQELFLTCSINCVGGQTEQPHQEGQRRKLNYDHIGKGGENLQKEKIIQDLQQFELNRMDAERSKLQRPLSDIFQEMSEYQRLHGSKKLDQTYFNIITQKPKKVTNYTKKFIAKQKNGKVQKLNLLYATYTELYPLSIPSSIPTPANLRFSPCQPVPQSLPSTLPFLFIFQSASTLPSSDATYHTCRLDPSSLRYRCSCFHQCYRGLPCRHILKICLMLGLEFGDYVLPYWKMGKSYLQTRIEKYALMGLEVPEMGVKNSARNCMRYR